MGASVQGTGHQKQDIPCQDAHTYRQLPGGTILIAVADGAGTASRAAEGARIAVQQAISALEKFLAEKPTTGEASWSGLIQKAIRCAYSGINQAAETSGSNLSDYASTLTLCAATPGSLVAAQIGDGVVIAQSPEGKLFTAAPPQQGEYANETQFITSEGALTHIDVHYFAETPHAIAAFTDGLTRLAVDLDGFIPHEPFFRPVFSYALLEERRETREKKLRSFLNSDRFNARTDDDKTLVVAVSDLGT